MAPHMLHWLRWPALTLSCIDSYAPVVHHKSFP